MLFFFVKGLKGQLEDLTSAMESAKKSSELSNQNDEEQTKACDKKMINFIISVQFCGILGGIKSMKMLSHVTRSFLLTLV